MTAGKGGPARGYRWPDATAGNTIALKSGAYSPRAVEPAAQALLQEVASDQATSYLAEPAYAATLRSWATAQARADLLAAWLAERPIEEQIRAPRGGARSPLEVWFGLQRTAVGIADRLGLTPLARARLGRDVSAAQADDVLAQLRAAGRQALDGRDTE